jgi:VanZ family protein
VLICGLSPFNFHSANGVTWLKTENGVDFHDIGIIYGPAECEGFDYKFFLGKSEYLSIELWLKPGLDDRKRFSYIFCLYDNDQRELFSLSQVKTLLNISKYQTPGKNGSTHNWRWLKDALFRGQNRFLTITSDKNSTTVYIDGKKAKTYRNYSLMAQRELASAWRMVIGNDPSGTKPWVGKIHSLAIYNHSLSPEQVNEHYLKWNSGSPLALSTEKNIIALYPMDEKDGQIIHNALAKRYHLRMPERFKILKRNLLKPPRNNLSFNSSNQWDMGINIAGFIPLGYFFFITGFSATSLKKSLWGLIFWAILAGTVVSLIIEILQAFLPTRHSSLTDLILNTVGTGLGVILASIYIKIKKSCSEHTAI